MAQTVFPAQMVAVILAHQLNRTNWIPEHCARSCASIWLGSSALERRDFSESITHWQLGDWTSVERDIGYRQQRLEKRSLSKLIADDLAANVLPLTQIHCTSLSRTLIDYH
jgi:hypothetical protein